MPRFRETTLAELGAAVQRRTLRAAEILRMPAVAFGCSADALEQRGKTDALKFWQGGRFAPAEVSHWLLPDAVVHGPFGIVTVGDTVLRESLLHVPFSQPGQTREDCFVTLQDGVPDHTLARAWHGTGGAFVNYYHWILDILPKLQVMPLGEAGFTGPILVPPPETQFLRETQSVLAAQGLKLRPLARGEAVAVQQLDFIANMTGAGFAPHPLLAEFYDGFGDIAAAAVGVPGEAPARLYITRANASRRRLMNEAEVAALAISRGYSICDPGEMTLAEQIGAFRAATHILAPHGAGLANLVFARSGATLCELQMDRYMNLCFRKLCVLRGVRYGSVVGDADRSPTAAAAMHGATWSVDLARVAQALDLSG